MTKKRECNFELLRIISIFMIILFHYSLKGGFIFPEELTTNKLIIKSFWMLGELGVNLFILISGYFSIKNKFKSKKFISIVCEIWFYNIITLIIANILGFKIDNLHYFFPIINNCYWFITAYLMLYLFSPFINKFINSLNRKDFNNLINLLLILFSIIPTVFGMFKNTTEGLMYYNRFIWMIVVYLIGAYISKYGLENIDSMNKSRNIIVSTSIFLILSIVIINLFSDIFSLLGISEVAYFWTPNSIPMVILSLGVFGFFLNLKVPYNPIIPKIASTTLGIYILHDGYFALKLWDIFNDYAPLNNPLFLIIHILIVGLIVLILGCVIDMIRQFLEKITIDKVLNNKSVKTMLDNFDNKIN